MAPGSAGGGGNFVSETISAAKSGNFPDGSWQTGRNKRRRRPSKRFERAKITPGTATINAGISVFIFPDAPVRGTDRLTIFAR